MIQNSFDLGSKTEHLGTKNWVRARCHLWERIWGPSGAFWKPFWFPSGVGWFDWASYATSISLEMAGIMMKYMDNIDRDHSMTLDHFEFAFNYAAMTHASAEAVFELLDENKDGKLSG